MADLLFVFLETKQVQITEVKSVEKNKLNILNKFFSRNTFRHCYEDGHDKVYGQVIKRYIGCESEKTNLELVSEIYKVLKNEYRNEYYYKNTLLNKLLLGIHSINTTTALTEIPVAKSKADFVLINGKAVVYEIKTELDNLDRLESQINDYFKAFDHVAVVTYKENIAAIQKKVGSIGKPVGIYVLQKRGTIKEVQEPEEYKEIPYGLKFLAYFMDLKKEDYEKIKYFLNQSYGGA
ncbi:sce7726 family protein [Faecalicatena fissicatena]|uniref:Sce7726 family protein n=1 Tax=Faecalicatena fissicatena TaxID=290055 RepID=A0ABX2GZW2_9FIRM|nr:sce7726 family protein [Faecalicatena fissicatena]NSD83629.1 sce7726 family protein [Faecalicatena fissicatena]NSE34279.1 sce7726 family protein [Faecalicatena fissicatena]NSE56030.1 sce7726 family protein [Faecalicatena fissicatena]NSE64951.1 sce7726 family protein [Faecalicatena fissicatena]NSG31152.1 sce7726 family protein [Faecalicatena fissicatena]